MRAAVYSRISRDAALEGKGVERQEEDCLALIERRGWTLTRIYRDNDVSAAGQVKKARPEFDAMLADGAAGGFDVLVSYSNSRLSRRPAEWLDLITLANAKKFTISTIASGSHDLTTADGRAVAMTVAIWDAAEADRTAERLVRQKAQRAAEGKPQGGRYRVYGYTRGFEVIESEAAVVKEVFERRAQGESTTAIANDLKSRGIKNAQGNDWTQANLGKIFTKPGYAGLRSHKGAIVGPTNYPPIISQAVYEAVTASLAGNKGTNARKHLLSGFLVCSDCLVTMNGKLTNAGTEKEKGTYICPPQHNGCGRSIKMAWADEAIVRAMWMKQQDTEGFAPTAVSTVSHDEEIKELNDSIEELEAAYLAKSLSLPDMLRMKAVQEKKRDGLIKESAHAVVSSLGPLQPFEDWEDFNLSQRRLYVDRFISNVVVYPPKNSTGKNVRDDSRLEVHFADGQVKRLANVVVKVVDRFVS